MRSYQSFQRFALHEENFCIQLFLNSLRQNESIFSNRQFGSENGSEDESIVVFSLFNADSLLKGARSSKAVHERKPVVFWRCEEAPITRFTKTSCSKNDCSLCMAANYHARTIKLNAPSPIWNNAGRKSEAYLHVPIV